VWPCGVGSVQWALAPIADFACRIHGAPLRCGYDELKLLHVDIEAANERAGEEN
jgi:hypothetical protein